MINLLSGILVDLVKNIFGNLINKWYKNFGKIKISLHSFELIDLNDIYYGMLRDYDENNCNKFDFNFITIIDIYNCKERTVTIKDLTIQLEINNKVIVTEISKMITNNKEMETYANSQFINVIKLDPKETKRVYFELKSELNKGEKTALENENYKLYFKYKKKASIVKKVSLKKG